MPVVSKTEASNAVSDYFVSALAGPKLDGRPVKKGDRVRLSEHQARALLASGALVAEADAVDDPFGDVVAAKAAEAAAEKAVADEAARKVQAEAEADAARKAAEAEAAQEAARKAAEDAGHHDDAHG